MRQSAKAEETIEQVQHLVDQLPPLEQLLLLASLTPRIVRAVAASPSGAGTRPESASAAWKEFFRLGDALAAEDTPAAETLTSAVLRMRR